MKQVMFLMTAALAFIAFLSFLPEEVVSKPGPRTIILSNKNTVVLNAPVSDESASLVQKELMEASSRLRSKDAIYLVLNSPGGSVSAGEKIIETAKGLSNPIHTITIFSASMSFIISQYLQDRLILETGMMMSHRAYAGGLEGQVPGNLVTRTLSLLNSIVQIDKDIAARSGYTTETYQELIRDELWMRGQSAIAAKFADEVVAIRCGNDLHGPGKEQSINVMGIFTIKVVFDKCPLITAPISISMDNGYSVEQVERASLLVNSPANYVRKYGTLPMVGHE